jgi:hypothetical protein
VPQVHSSTLRKAGSYSYNNEAFSLTIGNMGIVIGRPKTGFAMWCDLGVSPDLIGKRSPLTPGRGRYDAVGPRWVRPNPDHFCEDR